MTTFNEYAQQQAQQANNTNLGDFTKADNGTDITNMLATKHRLMQYGAPEVSDEVRANAQMFTDAFRAKNPGDTRSVIYKMIELNPNIMTHLTPEQIKTGTFPVENATTAFQDDMFGAYNAALQMLGDKVRAQNTPEQQKPVGSFNQWRQQQR